MMTRVAFGSYDFLVDLFHVTFLVGLLVSYLYFHRRQVSVGGSLAVGYLAASLYRPWNVVFTIAVSLLAWVIIKYVILKIWLPRPRQIFAIGLAVGVGCGGLWVLGSSVLAGTASIGGVEFALIGVIVPGMLCNSLIKQGVARTLVPLAWMVPLTGAVGLALTWLTSVVLPLSLSGAMFGVSDRSKGWFFGIAAVSVLLAILIQDGMLKDLRLRTGGYITAGLLVATTVHPFYLLMLVAATAVVYVIYTSYARRVPLFGKDRFLVLCLLSFVSVVVLEAVIVATTGHRMGGAENIVYCVLPAIMANDVIQHGIKRTGLGLGLSLAACAVVAAPFYFVLHR
ncbi:poly-gamma-glutamate biosynthesis protein PgsC/CapC [Corynebacterium uberis]|uniref:poly-gamma-glutamate biosynthesis protein PgsC/CapC n=1 Tax=Corynebacterium uberis TaxID=2883169 RepID=UPI001D0BBF59|nr:poly-gamma-glutamate biosynthesis protein PgsC/CapC [Corynebacterium uberis]UDL75018.1 poly-gamma-glutamate biosynthesis protein PgsC/CapC [Corynebacterium uberis]UDL77233.1 poly-gamma-glutamate biosynthesis protein PgsC/CapC [Corynebacterium uberis]UDL79515.1 poly-gamma-glutamate biosynthesis protein PgsC/CapC [Corynebacterium uberis]